MSRSTQAIVVADDRSLEFREVYLNEMQPDEVLVEIQASGVCHTDLSCAGNLLPTPLGAVLGHEGKYLPQPCFPPSPKRLTLGPRCRHGDRNRQRRLIRAAGRQSPPFLLALRAMRAVHLGPPSILPRLQLPQLWRPQA